MEELQTEATARTECGIDRHKQQDVLREIKQTSTSGACIFWHGVVVMCVLETVVVKSWKDFKDEIIERKTIQRTPGLPLKNSNI